MSDGQGERINEKDIICVVCPSSCRLTVWRDSITDEVFVRGNLCLRGKEYGTNEYTNPVRMLITTMRIDDGNLPVIPVRSTEPIPKDLLIDAVKLVNGSVCHAPVKMGDILIRNIFHSGIDVIASRNMDKVKAIKDLRSNIDEVMIQKVHSTLLTAFYGNAPNISKADANKLKEVEIQILKDLKKEFRKKTGTLRLSSL
jgi:CxxC motif-containing protein